MATGRSSHRVQRNTNDTVPIIGSALVPDVNNSVNDALHDTMSQGMSQATRRNYRSRISKIIKHFKENFPEYYEIGVRALTQEEIADRTKYYFKEKEDLIYTGLNVQFFMFFLSSTDKRADGKLKSHEDLRKYRDAVQWGAKMAGEHLPSSFYDSMEVYLIAYKKKLASAKKQGHVEEYSTDPIPLPVYRFLLRRSIETSNIFAWMWTLLQWNCMARSASIDCLAFHNFGLGTDSLVIKYDDSKADKAGEKLSEKNVYANPLDWTMCTWLALGIYCFVFQGNLIESERLFLKKGTKEGAGSSKYHEQVVGLIRGKEDSIATHMKFEKLNPYGLRKGAATHAVSGTTAAPSIPSIARRGEWSIGSVLDVYWHFGSVGDHYLGRILCGLDPNNTNFAILPPHWKVEDPLGNSTIKGAVNMMYGPILQAYNGKSENPTGIVLRCMACIVYHSDRLLETMVKYPGHDFLKIPILHDTVLLNELKELVTTEPTDGVMVSPTGVPPHVGLAIQVSNVLETLDTLVHQFGVHGDNLMLAVEEALDNKAWESGHVTGSRLKEILDEYRKESIAAVDRQLNGMRVELRRVVRPGEQEHHGADSDLEGFEIDLESGGGSVGGAGRKVRTVFSYDGRFYAVPMGYQFPKANLKDGLRCWLKEQVVSTNGMEKVKALKTISPTMLPKQVARQFRMNWQPVFKFLDPVLKELPRDTNSITDEVFETVYASCIDFLRERVSYVWKDRSNPREYSMATWSNKVSYSSIKKFGTNSDKSFLAEPTKRNQEKQDRLRRKRPRKENTRHPKRQHRTIHKANVGAHDNGNDNETFATAFENVGEMTEAMRQREAEIRLEVETEDQEAHHAEEVRRIREEGWTSRPIPLVRNYGDVSGFDRQQTVEQIIEIYPEGNPVRGVGLCCIAGCAFPGMQLLHRCNECQQFIHMVCAEKFNNLAEDERYCDKCIQGK
jgi:hypothetical protein